MALEYISKSDLVTLHLRSAIQEGRLRPGQRLVVDRVATELGLSKVPVREAVTRLTGEGLLELHPNVGPMVPSFTADDVHETALLRVAVESVALELAVPRHDAQSLARSGDVLERMTAEQEQFPELNVQFHLSLLSPASYPHILRTIESLLRRTQRFSTVHRVPDYRQEAHEEHQTLYKAVVNHDIAAALLINEKHITNASHKLIQRMRSQYLDKTDLRGDDAAENL